MPAAAHGRTPSRFTRIGGRAPRGAARSASLFLLEKLGRDVGIGGKPHLVAFDLGDQPLGNIMMMPSMPAHPAVGLGELDAAPFDLVDRADMDAVGADHFHMLANPAEVGHADAPDMCLMPDERAGSAMDASRARAFTAALAASTLLAACATQVPAGVEPEAPGFLMGLVHGVIAPFAWVVSLFDPKTAIYAVPNNGGWYDFGFVLGAGLFPLSIRRGLFGQRRD